MQLAPAVIPSPVTSGSADGVRVSILRASMQGSERGADSASLESALVQQSKPVRDNKHHPDGTNFDNPNDDEKAALADDLQEALKQLEQLSDARASAVLARCGLKIDFEAQAEKALRKVVARLEVYPCSLEWKALLGKSKVLWSEPPLRGRPGAKGDFGELEQRRQRWTETEESAIDSSLFSSTGVWTSPSTKRFALTASGFLFVLAGWYWGLVVLELTTGSVARDHIAFHSYLMIALLNVWGFILFLAMSALLHQGNRRRAKQVAILWAVTTILWVVGFVSHSVIVDDVYHGYFFGTNLLLMALALIRLSLFPAHSFYVLFGTGIVCCLNIFTSFIVFHYVLQNHYAYVDPILDTLWLLVPACCLFVATASMGSFILYKRQRAIHNFKEVEKNESYRYKEVWERLAEDSAFVAGLHELEGEWNEAMSHPSTVDVCKRQDGVVNYLDKDVPAKREGVQFRGHEGIEALFHKADAANPWFRKHARC